MSRLKRHETDVKLAEFGDDSRSLGLEICRVLAHKGFCTITTELTQEDLEAALAEVKDVHNHERFHRPSAVLQEGLLGGGSAEVAEFIAPWLPEKDNNGSTLTSMDDFMAAIAYSALGFSQETLGFKAPDRTLGWLHRSDDDPPGEEDEFTPEVCSRWLNHFVRARINAMIVLGPKGGLLELQPYDSESEMFEIGVAPGTMILLRADLLNISYNARNGEYAMTSWFCQSNISGPRSSYNVGLEGTPRIPLVQVLLDWAWDKIVQIKEEQGEGMLEVDPRIPREWQLAASRKLTRKRTQAAIRGLAFKLPNSIGLDTLYTSLACGCDFATDVPKQRWDHTEFYDPDPECYTKERMKTSINHCCFIDGADLFDNKFFSISNLEAKVMEPIQKNTLETTYEALHMAGYTSKGDKTREKLMQKFIGVYTAANTGEFMYIQHESAGGMAGSEGSPAIVANRVSFVLGMMGPSYTMQAEGASALLAIYEGAFDVLPTNHKNKPMVDASCCNGVYINLTPFWWPLYNAYMNPVGRTCTFDQDAGGYIRADGSSSIILKRHGEMIDGEFVVNNDVKIMGTLAGWAVTQNGRSASLNAPNAVAQQMAARDCLRQAEITPMDIDCVACHGEGRVLHDAVEVNALAKVLRDKTYAVDHLTEMLPLTGVACRMGMSQEAQGLSSFLMLMAYQRTGCIAGNLHLKVINPHIVEIDANVTLNTECSPLRIRTSFGGVNASGFSGTNVHIQVKNDVDEERNPPPKLYLERNFFAYWPGGGGQIEYSAEPVRGYTILGSWSSWQDLEPMEYEGAGIHGFTVTLGENRFEQFQILLDADRSRTLHPGQPMASMGSAVLGPDIWSEVDACNWLLDGRPTHAQTRQVDDSVGPDTLAVCDVDTAFTGVPGDQYRIHLQVSGKWRTVLWEKLADASGSAVRRPVQKGSYYVSGSWNDWSLEEMVLADAEKGLYALEVCLLQPVDRHFQVVRNMDPGQVLYPSFDGMGGENAPVEGPDIEHSGRCWQLPGKVGDVFRIEFQRRFELGVDIKQLSFQRVGSRTPEEERERRRQDLERRATGRRAQEEREAAELEALMSQ